MMVLVMNQVAARRCLTRQRRRFEAVGTLVCTIGQNRPARFSIRPKAIFPWCSTLDASKRKGASHVWKTERASCVRPAVFGALSWRSASSTWASRAIRRAMRCARSLRAASWRRSTRRGKRMQSNVEAVFGSGRRPHDLLGFERIMRATARSLRFPHVKSSC